MEEKTYTDEQISQSILLSVKKMLGYPPELKDFDVDIITNINSALMTLKQIGVGPKSGFFIEGEEETYEDFVTDFEKQKMINMYLFLKTKMGFDPPTSSIMAESYKEMIKEHEFRLQIQNDKEDLKK